MTNEYRHIPVLLAECLEQSKLQTQHTFVDATLGGAGHSSEFAKLLGPDGVLLGIDQDEMALAAAEQLAGEGISARVLDIHTIKPLDKALILKAAMETGCIVTSEEHNIYNGLGSAVASYLSEVYPTPVVRHGVEDVFGRSGKAAAVLEAYGISPAGIIEKVKKALSLKK